MEGNWGDSNNSGTGTGPSSSSSAAPASKTGSQHQNQGSGSGGTEEDSDSESESSSSSSSALENFRKAWEEELKKSREQSKSGSLAPTTTTSLTPSATVASPEPEPTGVEERARELFLMGIRLERHGDLFEAVRCYRRSIQLVPDIETRVSHFQNEVTSPNQEHGSPGADSDAEVQLPDELDEDGVVESDDDPNEPLIRKFLRGIEANDWTFFQKEMPDSFANTTHVSDVPVEVHSYILRWVVSSDLDVRSLDKLSEVSKGFYCLCRDETLWKMACEKVWKSCGILDSRFSSYREMFLKRSRVRFDGCYISKVTYVRPGEQTFQDLSYRPWHIVEYFRYLRFFPDGQIYFLTSSEQPAGTVGSFNKNPSTLKGKYVLFGNGLISAVVTKTTQVPVSGKSKGGRGRSEPVTTTFRLELEVQEYKGRCNWILIWKRYSVSTILGTEPSPDYNDSSFELTQSQFPNFYFSRVKSYVSSIAEKALS